MFSTLKLTDVSVYSRMYWSRRSYKYSTNGTYISEHRPYITSLTSTCLGRQGAESNGPGVEVWVRHGPLLKGQGCCQSPVLSALSLSHCQKSIQEIRRCEDLSYLSVISSGTLGMELGLGAQAGRFRALGLIVTLCWALVHKFFFNYSFWKMHRRMWSFLWNSQPVEIHKLSRKVVCIENERHQYLNVGSFDCFSHKNKETRTFCLNSHCARKLRTPTSCSDLKFFKLFFTLCIIVVKSKKLKLPKCPVAVPWVTDCGHPKKPAKSSKPSSDHLVSKRGKRRQMTELSSVSLLVSKFNLLV